MINNFDFNNVNENFLKDEIIKIIKPSEEQITSEFCYLKLLKPDLKTINDLYYEDSPVSYVFSVEAKSLLEYHLIPLKKIKLNAEKIYFNNKKKFIDNVINIDIMIQNDHIILKWQPLTIDILNRSEQKYNSILKNFEQKTRQKTTELKQIASKQIKDKSKVSRLHTKICDAGISTYNYIVTFAKNKYKK